MKSTTSCATCPTTPSLCAATTATPYTGPVTDGFTRGVATGVATTFGGQVNEITVTQPSVPITLPVNPRVGQTVRVISLAAGTTVIGGAFPIGSNPPASSATDSVPITQGTAALFEYSVCQTWIASYGQSIPSSGGGIQVANLAALAALNTIALGDESTALVATLDSPFVLEKTSTLAADGITIVNDAQSVGGTLPGRWLRRLQHVPRWTKQLVWYVDPVNATSDENNGATSGTALKSLAEVARRLRVVDLTDYEINLLSADPASDTFDTSFAFSGTTGVSASGGNQGTISIIGQRTTVQTGTVAGVGSSTFGTDPTAGGGGQQAQLNAGFSWASQIGNIVTITSGALAGYEAVVLKDLGSNTARLSNWWNPNLPVATNAPAGIVGAPFNNGTFAAAGNTSTGSPQNGDTIAVVVNTAMGGAYRYAGNPIRFQVYVKNVLLSSSAILTIEGGDQRFVGCQILCALNAGQARGASINAFARFFGCMIQAGGSGVNAGRVTCFDERARFQGCAFINTSVSGFNTGRIEFYNTVFQTGQADGAIKVGRGYASFVGDTAELNGQCAVFGAGFAPGGSFGLGIFDCTSVAVGVYRDGQMAIDNYLYGSGNLVGLQVAEAGHVHYRDSVSGPVGTFLVIAGTTQLSFDGAGTAIPPLVGGSAVPAASALATFANLVGSPFNGYAVSYRNRSSLSAAANPD